MDLLCSHIWNILIGYLLYMFCVDLVVVTLVYQDLDSFGQTEYL
jgi:hypothetical protein